MMITSTRSPPSNKKSILITKLGLSNSLDFKSASMVNGLAGSTTTAANTATNNNKPTLNSGSIKSFSIEALNEHDRKTTNVNNDDKMSFNESASLYGAESQHANDEANGGNGGVVPILILAKHRKYILDSSAASSASNSRPDRKYSDKINYIKQLQQNELKSYNFNSINNNNTNNTRKAIRLIETATSASNQNNNNGNYYHANINNNNNNSLLSESSIVFKHGANTSPSNYDQKSINKTQKNAKHSHQVCSFNMFVLMLFIIDLFHSP